MVTPKTTDDDASKAQNQPLPIASSNSQKNAIALPSGNTKIASIPVPNDGLIE
jgi:hypothetical protein